MEQNPLKKKLFKNLINICVSSRQNETFCSIGRMDMYAITWKWIENIGIVFFA